jgi:hypothetical protein
MANQVNVCGPNESTSIECLIPGDLFRYKNNTSDQNVYMRLDDRHQRCDFYCAVMLRTGQVYKIEPNSELIKLPKGTKITLVTGA